MPQPIRFCCTRCGQWREALIGALRSGLYRVDSPPYDRYARLGESVICEGCLLNDPLYQADTSRVDIHRVTFSKKKRQDN